jgi:probable F420-dependent oxidoreductase
MQTSEQHRPFRFGLVATGAPSRAAWLATARKAEQLGYATLLLEDHLTNALAPIAALMSAADATRTLRLGTFVFGNDFRHPATLAQEVATLDLLSGGRIELGLGTGYRHDDYLHRGLALDPPGTRVKRFEEAVRIIKGCFSDQPFTFAGEYYTLQEHQGLPKPLQRPHPPLLIGGGSRRMLSLAAREADIVSVNIRTTPAGGYDLTSITGEAAAEKVAWVQTAAGARRDVIELNIIASFVAVTDHRRQRAEELLRQWGVPSERLSVAQLLASPSALIGTVEQIVADLQERRARMGFSYIVVHEPMEPFAPVVERLRGR